MICRAEQGPETRYARSKIKKILRVEIQRRSFQSFSYEILASGDLPKFCIIEGLKADIDDRDLLVRSLLRVFEIWPGANTFFWSGRCMTGGRKPLSNSWFDSSRISEVCVFRSVGR